MQRTSLPAQGRKAVSAYLGLQQVSELRARGAEGLQSLPEDRRVVVVLDDRPQRQQVLYASYSYRPSYLESFTKAVAQIQKHPCAELAKASEATAPRQTLCCWPTHLRLAMTL